MKESNIDKPSEKRETLFVEQLYEEILKQVAEESSHNWKDDCVSYFKRHRQARHFTNFLFSVHCWSHLFLTPSGRATLADPQRRINIFNRENRVGMLEGSIFNADLHSPYTDNLDGKSLEYSVAQAGRWVGYDFHRCREFGPSTNPKTEGRLIAFMIDEVKGNGPDDYTPTGLFDLSDITHLLRFGFPPIEELLKEGFIKETTYKKAFSDAGVYGQYGKSLSLGLLDDKPLYAVTPKGNGLVALSRDGGRPVEKPSAKQALKPAFSFD